MSVPSRVMLLPGALATLVFLPAALLAVQLLAMLELGLLGPSLISSGCSWNGGLPSSS